MGDLDAAIQRLEAVEGVYSRTQHGSDLRTVIAAAKRPPLIEHESGCVPDPKHPGYWICTAAGHITRPPLTDATRERLIEVIRAQTTEEPHRFGGVQTVWPSFERLADAILAEYAPGVSTRERLAEAIDPNAQWGVEWAEPFDRDRYARRQAAALERADGLLASGAVEDRAEVEAKALEAAADRVRALGPGSAFLPEVADALEALAVISRGRG